MGFQLQQLCDALTKIETRSGTHYVCTEFLGKYREKYERGEIDIFEIVD